MKSNRIIPVVKMLAVIFIACVVTLLLASTAYAIDLPDDDPSIENIDAYRNILETGDMLVIVYENTPYEDTPDEPYSESFIWRMYDTDEETELAQAVGADYFEYGYGYNIISFYFDADDAPTWEQAYPIVYTGTATAFAEPPEYNFVMASPDYSSITDTELVKVAIAERIIEIALDLNIKWGLSTTYFLTDEFETGTRLSVYGQSFFREAIYGCQGMAPTAFPFSLGSITNEDREWTDAYADELAGIYTGTSLEDPITAGEELLDVDYNLMGMLIILGLIVMIIFAHWYLGSNNRWTGLVESAPAIVIGTRVGMMGMVEASFITALLFLYIVGRTFKVI